MKKLFCALLSSLFVLTPLCALANGIGETDKDHVTILWTTDPQWYSFAYPEILKHQNEWVVDNYERLGIEYIIHTGDFVDMPNKAEQWETVSPEYAKWDEAGIPYGVLAGNHDVDGTDHSAFSSYFGASRYQNNAWYGGDYDDNKGHFDLLTLGGVDFVFVYMGYGTPTDADIAWMNGVLEQHSDRIAFLMFHEFLDAEGNRTAVGNTYFDRVVLPNANVRMVLCGHNYNSARRSDSIDDNGDGTPDRTVHQIIANYQDTPKGGNGYMRFMELDTKGGTILCRTYSPYLDDFNYFDNKAAEMDTYGYRDEFTLDFDFSVPKAADSVGKVVADPRLALFDTANGERHAFAVDVCNQAVTDQSFCGIGVYDRTFSLRTADIAPVLDMDVTFAIAEYTDSQGYTVTNVTEDNVILPYRGVAIAFFGMQTPACVGQTVAFGDASTLPAPAPDTAIKLYHYDIQSVFGIDSIGGTSTRFAIYDRLQGDTVKATKNDAVFVFAPLAEHAGVYKLTEAWQPTATREIELPQGGFALKADLRTHGKTYIDRLMDTFFVGSSAAINGYVPEQGITLAGESVLSTDPADWTYDAGVMIVEQKDGALVLSNNNGLWPDGTYTLDTPMTFDPKTAGLYYDFTIQKGNKTSMLLLIGNQYVKLNSYFAGVTISEGSGDVKGDGSAMVGTIAFADLPIPKSCYNDDGTVTLYGMQIYACGPANMTNFYRELRVIADMGAPVWPDYTPPVREEEHPPIDNTSSENPQESTDASATTEKNDPIVWYVLAGAALLAVITAITLIIKRKH